jgi:hypothetical protein
MIIKKSFVFSFIFCFLFFYEIAKSEKNAIGKKEKIDASDFQEEEIAPEAKEELKEIEENFELPAVKEKETKPEEEFETTEEGYSIPKSKLQFKKKSMFKAFALSFLVGFGTGNFYAENHWPGYVTFTMQLIGFSVLGAGLGMYYSADPKPVFFDNVLEASEGLLLGGLILGLSGRLLDIGFSIYSVHDYNKRNEFKLQSNIMPIYFRDHNKTNFVGLAYRF